MGSENCGIFFGFLAAFFFRVHSALCLGSFQAGEKLRKEGTLLFGCLMVTALPGPAALRTLWLPHGNGFCLSTLFLPIEPPMNTEPKKIR